MSEYMTMKEMPETERPYEKCLLHGPEILSDAELIAVLLKSGSRGERSVDMAHRILNAGPDGILNLYRMSIAELMQIRGIGKVKAIQLKCAGELSVRLSKAGHHHGRSFENAQSIADCYMESLRHQPKELVILLSFDIRGQMIAEDRLTVGTAQSSLIAPAEVFETALQRGAKSLVLLHNHPSGNPMFSEEDYYITEQLRKGARILGIRFWDHIIIGDNRFFSFHDHGYLDESV